MPGFAGNDINRLYAGSYASTFHNLIFIGTLLATTLGSCRPALL